MSPRKGRHIEVFQSQPVDGDITGEEGDWRWRVVGGNGEIMDQSEGYTGDHGKYDALRAADDLHHPLPIWVEGPDGELAYLRPEDEVMGGPGEPPAAARS